MKGVVVKQKNVTAIGFEPKNMWSDARRSNYCDRLAHTRISRNCAVSILTIRFRRLPTQEN